MKENNNKADSLQKTDAITIVNGSNCVEITIKGNAELGNISVIKENVNCKLKFGKGTTLKLGNNSGDNSNIQKISNVDCSEVLVNRTFMQIEKNIIIEAGTTFITENNKIWTLSTNIKGPAIIFVDKNRDVVVQCISHNLNEDGIDEVYINDTIVSNNQSDERELTGTQDNADSTELSYSKCEIC